MPPSTRPWPCSSWGWPWGLLLQGPIAGIAWTLVVAVVAVVALAVATGGWLLGPARPPERVLAGLAAPFLLYLEPAGTPRLEALPLVATEVGRRTLVAGDRRVPLFEEGGAAAHLVLSVRR